MSKADNKPYDNTHEESEKKSKSTKRERGYTKTIKKTPIGVRYRMGLEGKEKGSVISHPPSGKSKFEHFSENFFREYGVRFDADPEKISKAAWFLKKRNLILSFFSFEPVWITNWKVYLEDLEYKVAKKTLKGLLDSLYDEKLIGLYIWKPKSRKMFAHRIFYALNSPESLEKLERRINILNEQDLAYYNVEKRIERNKKKESTRKRVEKSYVETQMGISDGKKTMREINREATMCEHGFGPQECGLLEACPNYKWKKLIRDSEDN